MFRSSSRTTDLAAFLVVTAASPLASAAPPDAPVTDPPASTATLEQERPARETKFRARKLEGGVDLAASTELWAPGTFGAGARLDVGVGVGGKFAVVIGEAARFSLHPRHPMTACDLQVGVAYGAPYQLRTGWGIVLSSGVERLSTAPTSGGLVAWSAIGALGVRASVTISSLDFFIGIDAIGRSNTIEAGAPDPFRVANLTALLSLGYFLPAFERERSNGL
jgi:hypothetical protein